MSWAKVRASGIIDGDLRFIDVLTEIRILDGSVHDQVDAPVEESLKVFYESEVGVSFAAGRERLIFDQNVDVAGLGVEVADGCGAEDF